jgi:hypothetical protein
VTDIFFSYKSADRDRVSVIHDVLTAEGFDVFWDQQVEAGIDWDTWIRNHLTQAKCVVVFWSKQSIASDNVRHEATVAKRQNKLIHVMLDPLTPEEFPMGLYTVQAANLTDWKDDVKHAEWKKLCREVEHKLTPLWIKRQIDELEAELVAERARLAGVERREKVLQAQIVKEVQLQADLRQQHDKALNEATALKEDLRQARSEAKAHAKAEARAVELSRRLNEAETHAVELSRRLNEAEAHAVDLSQRLKEAEAHAVELSQRLSEAHAKLDELRPAPPVAWPETLKAEFHKASPGYLYRVEKDGSVSAVNIKGKRMAFPNEKEFLRVVRGSRTTSE